MSLPCRYLFHVLPCCPSGRLVAVTTWPRTFLIDSVDVMLSFAFCRIAFITQRLISCCGYACHVLRSFLYLCSGSWCGCISADTRKLIRLPHTLIPVLCVSIRYIRINILLNISVSVYILLDIHPYQYLAGFMQGVIDARIAIRFRLNSGLFMPD